MSPEFAKAIDPIFIAALSLEEKLESHQPIVTADERANIIRAIETADRRLGPVDEWRLAKYAICSWIDSRLIESNWKDAAWWKEQCLEKKFFGSRDAHEEFFKRASEAAGLPKKDALEVFYIAVVLGFRGFYGNPDISYMRKMTSGLRIAESLEAWCFEVSRTLQLGIGRPQVKSTLRVGGTNSGLNGRTKLMAGAMTSTLLIAIALAIVAYVFFAEKS